MIASGNARSENGAVESSEFRRMDGLGKAIIGNSGCEKPWNMLKKKR